MVVSIYNKLYQFTEMAGQMSLPVHQYLLVGEPSIMFATGSYSQAKWILPQVDEILNHAPLKYLFISHMESDECGGLSLFLKKYPKLIVICSSFTARELKGFGFKVNTLIGEENRNITEGNISLKFFQYPAEVHLNDGILVSELNSGIFYSSDLMFHHINGSQTQTVDWLMEVESINHNMVRDDVRREKLKDDLKNIHPKFIAVGHGSCSSVI